MALSGATVIGGISLAWPLAGLAALLLPILIWAYLKREKRTRIYVSSLLLYRMLPKRPRAKQKFKPPLQFFIELLALLALLTAMLGPFIVEKKEHIAILIDTSYSMNAKSLDGRTQTDAAIELLSARLRLASKSSRFSIFRSSPSLLAIGSARIKSTAVLPSLKDTVVAQGVGSLEAAIEQLAFSKEYDRIYVVSDRSATKVPSTSEHLEIEVISPQRFLPNVFVEDFLFTDPLQREALIRVGSSADSSIKGTLRVYGSTQVGAKERLIHEQNLRLRPPNNQIVKITLKSKYRDLSFFRATISANRIEQNSLSEDDSAWLARDSSASSNLLLVGYTSKGGVNDRSGLEQASRGKVTLMTATEYANAGKERISSFDSIVFYGVVPPELPQRPSLFILPPRGSTLIPVVKTLNETTITSWKAEHPLLRYLQVPLLVPREVILFDVPDWGQALLNAKDGPIAFAGLFDGVRILALGFEVLPFEGRKSLASSILLLNSIKWLSQETKLGSNLQIGSSIRLPSSRTWVIRNPDGNLETFVAKTKRLESYSFSQSGMFIVSSAPAKGSKTETRVYAVQGYSVSESYTWQPPELALSAENISREDKELQASNFWPWLSALAFVLLFLQTILTSGKWRTVWT